MTVKRLQRVRWLLRRLSRIYPNEIPYRIAGVARAALQQRHCFDASRAPPVAVDAAYGQPWVSEVSPPWVDVTLVIATADRYLTVGLPVFDITVAVNADAINWNRDPKTGIEIPLTFGLGIDFRHLAGGVDIKYLWELNRHIWWVPLAQAYVLSGDDKYLGALAALLRSWLAQCPYPLGANWSSPVEHGIRLINWSIVWHLIGGEKSPMFEGAEGKVLLTHWLNAIYQHIRFASDNYSFYSSSDNHLIGEAAGIFVAAHTWNRWAAARALRGRAKAILEAEILKQFSADGVNLEQAICYHKFSLEFLLAAHLCGSANADDFSASFNSRLLAAIEFMAALMNCKGQVPSIGDSDDGRVFGFVGDGSNSAYESLLRAGAQLFKSPALHAKLAQLGVRDFDKSLWLKLPVASAPSTPVSNAGLGTRFETGGYVVLGKALHTEEELRITMDVGALGYNRIAGHGHADALSVLLSVQGKDFLIDPGTFCYNAEPQLRQYFRGTSAHNTVVIDGVDQAVYGGSFLWLSDMDCKLEHYQDSANILTLEASHNGYLRLADPVRHFRRLSFNRETSELVVEDRFSCKGQHRYALHWHFAPQCSLFGDKQEWFATREVGSLVVRIEAPLTTSTKVCGQVQPPMGWVSRKFYEKQPTNTLVIEGAFDSQTLVTTHFLFNQSKPA